MNSQGFAVFWHALTMVTGNFGAALRISLPWMVLYAIVIGIGAIAVTMLSIANPVLAQMVALGGGLALVVIAIVIASILAIYWHRFVLLGEMPQGYLGVWREQKYGEYSTQIIKFSILAILPIAPFSYALNNSQVFWPVFLVGSVIFQTISSYVFLRLAIGLPAIALGKEKLNVKQSWQVSRPFSNIVWAAALFLAFLNEGLSLFLLVFSPASTNEGASAVSPLAFVVVVAISWFISMVGISLLTTLYGHFIEKRPI